MTELPPGPRLPRAAQTALLVLRPEPTLRRWHRRYGDVFTARPALAGTMVFIADPAAIRDVFTASPDALRAGEANAFLAPLLGARSLLVLDGAQHLRQRKLLLPPLHGARMRAYEAVMREAADADIDTWPVGRPFALLDHMQAVTLEVIARAVFGVQATDPDGTELRRRLRALLTPMRNQLRLLVIAVSGGLLGRRGELDRRFAARMRAVDELLYALIARRRADPALAEREDICAMLLQARDADGQPMTDDEVRDELMTLLVAGHETTATALAWAFERLLRHPGALAELQRTLEAGDDSYLDAVVRETLRVRPVVPSVGRILHAEHRVRDWTLPPGVEVAPSIVLTHGNPRLHAEPEAFRPERFLGEDGATGISSYTWIPFGGGTRRCIGAAFAEFEMRTVLRTALERTSLEAVGRRSERVRRTGVTLVPAHGARVRQRRPPTPRAHADGRVYEGVRTLREDRAAVG